MNRDLQTVVVEKRNHSPNRSSGLSANGGTPRVCGLPKPECHVDLHNSSSSIQYNTMELT